MTKVDTADYVDSRIKNISQFPRYGHAIVIDQYGNLYTWEEDSIMMIKDSDGTITYLNNND